MVKKSSDLSKVTQQASGNTKLNSGNWLESLDSQPFLIIKRHHYREFPKFDKG